MQPHAHRNISGVNCRCVLHRARHRASGIFDALQDAVAGIGPAELRITKSQIAFRNRRNFALAWMPGIYLSRATAPLVLTVLLGRRDGSPRWKQIVEPAPGRFTHHLELHTPAEIDDEVRAWLQEAWDAAGQRTWG